MATDKELLEDTSFDREVVPKDQEGDLLVSLFKKKAFDKQSAMEFAKYFMKEDILDRLIKDERIVVFSESPMKVYLAPIGKIIACGEFALRRREAKK